MGILKETEKVEEKIRVLIDRLFGKGTAREPLEIRRAILREVEGRIESVGRNKRVFPFNRISITLFASSPDQKAVFEATFLEGQKLENDIRELLNRTNNDPFRDLEISIHIQEQPLPGGREFLINYERQAGKIKAKSRAKPNCPRIQLIVLRGGTTKRNYVFTKARVNIGRLSEIVDGQHRIVRRNDLIFKGSGDEIDQTVSREHAHISFDETSREFRLYDDGSAYGTRIFREGRTVDVQSGNRWGVKLQSGDEIFFGQACTRFEIKK
jgi:FHA domain